MKLKFFLEFEIHLIVIILAVLAKSMLMQPLSANLYYRIFVFFRGL